VRKTPPSLPRDERAIARSLDVWRDLRRGTHGVGSCLGRGASVRCFFGLGAVLARIVAYGQPPFRHTDDIGEMTVTKGYATMRAHTAPQQNKNTTLAPRPKRDPTPCVPLLKSRQMSNEGAIARSSRGGGGGHFPHCLWYEDVYRYKKLTTKVRGAGRASIFGRFFFGGEINDPKGCIDHANPILLSLTPILYHESLLNLGP
jgi:hypothetical protein